MEFNKICKRAFETELVPGRSKKCQITPTNMILEKQMYLCNKNFHFINMKHTYSIIEKHSKVV